MSGWCVSMQIRCPLFVVTGCICLPHSGPWPLSPQHETDQTPSPDTLSFCFNSYLVQKASASATVTAALQFFQLQFHKPQGRDAVSSPLPGREPRTRHPATLSMYKLTLGRQALHTLPCCLTQHLSLPKRTSAGKAQPCCPAKQRSHMPHLPQSRRTRHALPCESTLSTVQVLCKYSTAPCKCCTSTGRYLARTAQVPHTKWAGAACPAPPTADSCSCHSHRACVQRPLGARSAAQEVNVAQQTAACPALPPCGPYRTVAVPNTRLPHAQRRRRGCQRLP